MNNESDQGPPLDAEPEPLTLDPDKIVEQGLVYFRGQTSTPAVFRAFDVTRANILLTDGTRRLRAVTMYVQLNNGPSLPTATVRFYGIPQSASDGPGRVVIVDGTTWRQA